MSNSYSYSNNIDSTNSDSNNSDTIIDVNINDIILDDNNNNDDYNNNNDDYNDIFIDSESKILNTNNKYVNNDERITKNKITKYEKVRIIGLRVKQLSSGAKPLIKHDNILKLSPYEITMLEYENKTIPFKIRRPLPDDTYELWKFNELV